MITHGLTAGKNSQISGHWSQSLFDEAHLSAIWPELLRSIYLEFVSPFEVVSEFTQRTLVEPEDAMLTLQNIYDLIDEVEKKLLKKELSQSSKQSRKRRKKDLNNSLVVEYDAIMSPA